MKVWRIIKQDFTKDDWEFDRYRLRFEEGWIKVYIHRELIMAYSREFVRTVSIAQTEEAG